MTLPIHTLSVGDVARVFGLTAERIRQLDDELKPIKLPNGQRRYDPRDVQRLVDKRRRAA